MPDLKDIVYCSEEQLETMASGTPVGGHEYNEDDLYITPLGDDILVGADNSGTKINENNELIVDSFPLDISSPSHISIILSTVIFFLSMIFSSH